MFAGDLEKLNQQASDLPERMRIINRNAIEIATFLEEHPAIEQVWHPSLEDKELTTAMPDLKQVMEGSFHLRLNFLRRIPSPFMTNWRAVRVPISEPSLHSAVRL